MVIAPHALMKSSVCTHIYVYMYLCMRVYVCVYIYIRECACVCVWAYINIHMHVCVCISTRINTLLFSGWRLGLHCFWVSIVGIAFGFQV